mgnify:CR=1 FL=1
MEIDSNRWFEGSVVRGLQNGRKLGFPTANVKLTEKADFETGAYAVEVEVAAETLHGMLYVGTRPTLGLTQTTLEIHIFDFHRDIYDLHIRFRLLKKIAPEQKFENLETLKAKLQQYKTEILHFLYE